MPSKSFLSRYGLPLLVLCLNACSFDPPSYVGSKDSTPDRAEDQWTDDGTDVPDDVIKDTPNDQKPDTPVVTAREVGEVCETGAQCASGRCQEFGDQKICTQPCTDSCPSAELVCSRGFCTPKEYCENVPVLGAGGGPGCLSCEVCSPDATCQQQPERVDCTCNSGFTGDGYSCVDIDECASPDTNDCSSDGICQNTPGDFRCKCKQGFEGDGRTCVEDNACDVCDVNASCANNACTCDAGYQGDGVICADIDECAAGTDSCSDEATCTNTQGSFSCACVAGFEGNGTICTDINECALDLDNCDALATCNNTPGSFSCTCPPGTTGGGVSCQVYGSCAEILSAQPGLPDGAYTIATSTGRQQVYCDMTSDGGAGYTMLRVAKTSLERAPQAYADECALLGMEIVVPRTQAHLASLTAYNQGVQPSVVNVFPDFNGAPGINQWSGSCQGQPCSFYVGPKPNTRCKSLQGGFTVASPGTWSDATLAQSCRDYKETSGGAAPDGVYAVDVDGSGPLPITVDYCNMTQDGGGWTLLVITADDNANTWTWNNGTLWTTERIVIGSLSSLTNDYKAGAYHTMPGKDLMFMHLPSNIWASYHDVLDGVQDMGTFMQAQVQPFCDAAGGWNLTAGTLTQGGSMCSTKLYFNPGDYDGRSRVFCETINGNSTDESTLGPAWSLGVNNGCDFDDPALGSMGPRQDSRGQEVRAYGYGLTLNLNTGTQGTGVNAMRMFARGERDWSPQGENASTEPLVLLGSTLGSAGPQCPDGSWDDTGGLIQLPGSVICAIN